MLQMGKEKPWPDALDVVCGSRKMTSEAILDYFAPLERWLDAHRKLNEYTLGWDSEESGGKAKESASAQQQQSSSSMSSSADTDASSSTGATQQDQQNTNMSPFESMMKANTNAKPQIYSYNMIETDSDSAKTVIQDMPTINE